MALFQGQSKKKSMRIYERLIHLERVYRISIDFKTMNWGLTVTFNV